MDHFRHSPYEMDGQWRSMSHPSLPTLFLSHGPPTMVMEDHPARDFMRVIGPRFRSARAVLCISAHWETTGAMVSGSKRYATIHDFSGFPEELYGIHYPARGLPDVAQEIVSVLEGHSISCTVDHSRGLDHGAWAPLSLMFPDATVPVLQLSIQRSLDPRKHYGVGQALAPLRSRGILILGSGGAVHPLGYFRPRFDGSPPETWALQFEGWLTDQVESGDHEDMIEYRKMAPYPDRAHPRPDHYMPLLVAAGASGGRGKKIHDSWAWGDVGMGAYEFE
jgi:4,5-DOPA dioxygenase extradiol